MFRRQFLDGIAAGSVSLAFRRWARASVRPGTLMRTRAGVVAVESVDIVDAEVITAADADAAGYRSVTELLADLDRHGIGRPVYRIGLRLVGPDPRIALRADSDLDDEKVSELAASLDRMDRARATDPWTRLVLRLIRDEPGVRAPDLAARLGRETRPFKADVRKLKELGLTESLRVGYRLSPRGEALLDRLDTRHS